VSKANRAKERRIRRIGGPESKGGIDQGKTSLRQTGCRRFGIIRAAADRPRKANLFAKQCLEPPTRSKAVGGDHVAGAIEPLASRRGQYSFYTHGWIRTIQVAGVGDNDTYLPRLGFAIEHRSNICVSCDREDVSLPPTVRPDRFDNSFRRSQWHASALRGRAVE
jgi:hypothetical protein